MTEGPATYRTILTAEEYEAVAAPLLVPPRETRFGRVSWADLDAPGPEISYVIDDWMTAGDKSVLGGASGSGKSFLAIDAGLAIARGRPWFGNETRKGLVIYQAGEGGRGVKRRLRAYRKHFGVPASDRVPFELLTARIDIFAPDDGGGDTARLIEAIRGIARDWPDLPLQAVFIDTLAVAQGGADEISGKDMAVVLGNIDRIARETGAHVCLVHHMNADGKKLRGHTSLRANVDQVIVVSRNETTNVRTATLDKMKDGEDGRKLQFELLSVDVGEREDGKRLTSCVCLPLGEKEAIRKEEATKGLTLNQTEIGLMKAFFEADRKHGRPVPADLDIPASVRSVVEWSAVLAAYASMNPIDLDMTGLDEAEIEKVRAGHKDKHKKRVQRSREYLQNAGVMGIRNPLAWWTGKPLRAFPHTQPRQTTPDIPGLSPELQALADQPPF